MSKTGSIAAVIAQEDLLQRRIERALERAGFAEPRYRVAVMIRDGTAHLSGSVRYEDEIAIVGDLVSEMNGIENVVNRLLYREPPPAQAR